MSSIKTQALVLNSIKWKDSSRIVTLFTHQQGRIKVIVHGAAREKSRFRGKLETLNLLECLIAYRKSRSLQVLTGKNRFLPTTTAVAPSKREMAAPIAVSI